MPETKHRVTMSLQEYGHTAITAEMYQAPINTWLVHKQPKI